MRSHLQRLARSVHDSVRRRPRTALAAVIVAAAIAIGCGTVLLQDPTAGAPPAAADPGFTYGGTWSLLELQRHIDAGEIVAITAPGPTPDGAGQATPNGHLAAKTRTGQVVKVDLGVAPSEALSALSSLGYGELLTDEAWMTVRTARAGGGGGDPLRTVVTWLIPLALLAGLFLVLLRVMARAGGGRESPARFRVILPGEVAHSRDGGGAGRAPAAGRAPDVRLADVAGCDEAKLELTETIEFLKAPERFRRLGARIPRGIMLFGPPGTGKTMLARAVATEAGVPFHYASGSEFVEKYVGVGARRVRDLFAQARRLGRGVIFFDEFDAIGKARGGQNSHEEREQTLNQLLVELDGFGTTDDVVVIAATNRLDILDSAVLRPGRFNRKIHVGLPDVKGRQAVLEVHAKDKPLDASVDLATVARRTYGFSGAQLADLLNESAIMAARRGGDAIASEDLHAGWLKVAVGTSRRRSMDERERSIIAAHEVGHAICGRVRGDKRRVEEISLFAHGDALGVTVSSQEDNDLPSESDLRARLVALMGGRAAEELLFQEVTGGASNDFEKANSIATQMVTRWGMGVDPEAREAGVSGRGALSFLVARGSGSLPSDVQAAATRAIRAILDEAYAEACRTLVEHMETLRRTAAYLFQHERVDGETFDALFEGRLDVPDAAAEWRAATARPRDWHEIEPYLERRRHPVAPIREASAGRRPDRPELPAPAEPARVPLAATAPVAAADAARGRRGVSAGPWFRRRVRRAVAAAVQRAGSWVVEADRPADRCGPISGT